MKVLNMKKPKQKFKQYPYMITETSFPYPMDQEQIIDCNNSNAAYTSFIESKLATNPSYKENMTDKIRFMASNYEAELSELTR